MTEQPNKPRITATIAGRPLHPLLRPFAVGYFLATLACDLIYVQSSANARFLAQDFGSITEWLLIAGLVAAVLSGVVAIVDLMGERRFRDLPDLAWYVGGSALVVALELYNLGIRVTGGTEAIKPTGMIVSLAAVAVLLATPSRNWAMMYRHAR
jgi:uncharacterized membrane protein